MLLQAQASVPAKLSMRLNSFLMQDLSDSFRVIKAVEQAAPETPSSHHSLGPFFTQSDSKSIALEKSGNLLGSAARSWQLNLCVSHLGKKVTPSLGTSCRCEIR